VWSPLIPPSRRGTEWSGLAHVSDWFYTYAVGVAGVALSDARGAGPYPDDGKNLWAALTSVDAAMASPRTEVAHMVHSPEYYPGNCTMSCWQSRSCPMVITVGDMKLSVGFIGDPRIVTIEEHAGVGPNGSAVPVAWGLSGGHCGVTPPAERWMYGGGDQQADPNCSTGLISPVDHKTCCPKSCTKCGGADCGALPGGENNCCRGDIDRSGRSCDAVGPPCVMGGGGGGKYADRCTAPGMGGTPAVTPTGLCVSGCLFNVTAGEYCPHMPTPPER
jgi:hypothetical protein